MLRDGFEDIALIQKTNAGIFDHCGRGRVILITEKTAVSKNIAWTSDAKDRFFAVVTGLSDFYFPRTNTVKTERRVTLEKNGLATQGVAWTRVVVQKMCGTMRKGW